MKQKADVEIFTPGEGELADLTALEALCFSDPWSARAMEGCLASPVGVNLAVRVDGELVGYVLTVMLYEECEVLNLAVAPQYRRMGLGRAMMDEIIARARIKGVERVLLEVRQSNGPAISLYSSLGFERYGIRKDYYENPMEDAILMAMSLC